MIEWNNQTIYKAGALIFDADSRVLAVHKRGKPPMELIVPGGKIAAGESDKEAIHRELLEELNVGVLDIVPYHEFQAKAIYEDALLIMRTYFVRIEGVPYPGQEIDQMVWLDANFGSSGYQFASILGQQILPRLVREGRLSRGAQ